MGGCRKVNGAVSYSLYAIISTSGARAWYTKLMTEDRGSGEK